MTVNLNIRDKFLLFFTQLNRRPSAVCFVKRPGLDSTGSANMIRLQTQLGRFPTLVMESLFNQGLHTPGLWAHVGHSPVLCACFVEFLI